MSERFVAPDAAELARRGLNPDGTPMKAAKKKKPAAKAPKKKEK